MSMTLPHEALVLVCDARKALFFKNVGSALAPALEAEATLQAPDNPRSSEQGVERPGKTHQADGRKSGVEPTDFHALAEAAFARDVAEALEKRMAAKAPALFVVAPPRFLASLRTAYGHATKAALRAELDKDLTKLPVKDILRSLSKA
ncbi:MAG TPA: host attachment protein [Beijerinckiaceae bacterium]|nr:host attachment protein [Beijerinckiaceae bacterium]